MNGTQARIALLYRFCRLQRPRLTLGSDHFGQHLERMHRRAVKVEAGIEWNNYITRVLPLDAFLASSCLENMPVAWETLFAMRLGRADRFLIDALRLRAARLYPGDEQEQESAVQEFWGHLLVSPVEGSVPILARYDALRPLVPWLLRVFQNKHISKLRSPSNKAAGLEEDDLLPDTEPAENNQDVLWHQLFCDSVRTWLSSLTDQETLLLGLRWRYRLSQREAATWLGVHEGTLSRQIDKLRDRCINEVSEQLEKAGWTGEDVTKYILAEMAPLLLEEPKLSLQNLGKLMKKLGKAEPKVAQ